MVQCIDPILGNLLDHLSNTTIHLIVGEAGDGRPLGGTLGRHLRALILDGSLRAGERLPSSRALAKEIGVARGTVETSYGDLEAEGLVERRRGSGSFVSPSLGRLERPASETASQKRRSPGRLLSVRGAAVARMAPCPYPMTAKAFANSTPDLREFPWALWRRLWSDGVSGRVEDLASYSDPRGHYPLRQSLARWLRVTRGIKCVAEQVLVLHSAQQALALCATLLFDRGEQVAVEDPGYPGAVAAFTAAGLRPVAVPVDRDGVVSERLAGRPDLRGLYVTPSHQNPLGVTLSLRRRLDLIAWAAKTGAWIIEDDYGGGLSYDHAPIAALTGLDGTARSLYIGSGSKLLFPGLRLAWMVLPEPLLEAFATLRANRDGHSAALTQACLARFIDDGHLAKHVRRMTSLYRARRDSLVGAIEGINRTLDRPLLHSRSTNAGLKLAVELSGGASDRAVAARARAQGLELPTLSSSYADQAKARQGFILGFAALNQIEIAQAVRILGGVIASHGIK